MIQYLKRFSFLCYATVLISANAIAQTNINVDVSKKLNNVSSKPIGINMDYLMDGSYISPAPAISTTESLKNMGVKFLRYPGGEKSDNYLWSASPWTKASPRYARKGTCEWPSNDSRFALSDYAAKAAVLDFDEFMTMAKEVSAQPLIVVAYDAIYKASSCGGKIPTKEELLVNAEEWVRYANIVKKYNIKYWMVGNESWNATSINGQATAAQYRDDIILFSQRMKAVDPTIKIIANGDKASWWSTVLPKASPYIDFLGLSNYPVYNFAGYDKYRTSAPDLMGVVNTAVTSINNYAQTADKNRIKVITSEFNSIDWAYTWTNNNDLGHALTSFEILGEHLKNPKVESTYFWNTRWVDNTTKSSDIFDAIRKDGSLEANGLALSIWGNYLLDDMVSTSSTTGIRSYASYSSETNELNIYIVNKELTKQSVKINISNYVNSAYGEKWELKGSGPGDVSPVLSKVSTLALQGSSISTTVNPVSITVLTLKQTSNIITGITDNNAKTTFGIYPNPAHEKLNIQYDNSAGPSIKVKAFSVDGKEIYSATHPSTTGELLLDISGWANGLYIIQVDDGLKTHSHKAIVN